MSPSDLPSASVFAPALVMLILGAGIRAHQNSKERGSWTIGYTIFVWWLRLVVAIWVIGFGVLVAKSVWLLLSNTIEDDKEEGGRMSTFLWVAGILFLLDIARRALDALFTLYLIRQHRKKEEEWADFRKKLDEGYYDYDKHPENRPENRTTR